ncbi:MAG: helix-turn-helix domain-containing protein [Armatimonadetes bacterium]|nr:helix-turn-helix domain-containing protein [Armatimonadota bacterium]
MSRILSVEQAAEKLQMTPKVVREYLRLGKIPGRKVGRAWRVLESDLERWVSTGQSERKREFVSARGFLKKYPGTLSSEEVNEAKRLEAEIEEEKFRQSPDRARKSA